MEDVVWRAERCLGFQFLTLPFLVFRRASCCSFVNYEEEEEGEGGFHSYKKKRVANPSVKSLTLL